MFKILFILLLFSNICWAQTYEVSTGNLGVNTASPTSVLGVGGNLAVGGVVYTNASNPPTNGAIIQGNVGIGTIGFNAGLSVMNGNVGIGTWNPIFALQTESDIGVGTYTVCTSQGLCPSGNSGTVTSITALSPLSGGVITTTGNIGIGTALGNISTFGASGNVGIGSVTPGQLLDVAGTIRQTGFVLSGNNATQGYVLMASGSVGIGTWSAVASSGGGTPASPTSSVQYNSSGSFGGSANFVFDGNNVGIGTIFPASSGTALLVGNTTNVGIGTTFVGGAGEGALTVMNGNVGIGTWVPKKLLTVGSGANTITVDNTGNLTSSTGILTASYMNSTGIYGYQLNGKNAVSLIKGDITIGDGTQGTWTYTDLAGGNVGVGTNLAGNQFSVDGGVGIGTANSNYVNTIAAPSGGMIVQGNVGFGTFAPTGILEVEGGNVGIGTFVAPSGGSNNLLVNGNIGVGTTFVGGSGEGALTVMNGNVGIGTWIPAQILNVNGAVQITGSGNSGIGTLSPTGALEVEGGNVGIGTNVQPEVLSVKGGIAFSGNLAGGLTGNVGIGTTVTGAGATCDSSCNTAGKRCFGGIVTATSNFEPCSVSIIGDCICLPAT